MKFFLLNLLFIGVVISAPTEDDILHINDEQLLNKKMEQPMIFNIQEIIQSTMDRIVTLRENANKQIEEIKQKLPTQEKIMEAIEENLMKIKEQNEKEAQAVQATINNIQKSVEEVQKEYMKSIEEQLQKVKEVVNKEIKEVKDVLNYIEQLMDEKKPGIMVNKQTAIKPNEVLNLIENILQIIQQQAKETGLLSNITPNLALEQIKETILSLQNGSNNILQQIMG
jgi:hypothetical protein